MNSPAQALLAEFEAAAKKAQAAETELRKSLSEQIARIERQRAFAFRRTRLVRTLAEAAINANPETEPEAEAEAAIWAAQRRAVRDELGWAGESKVHEAILAQLQPVGLTVWRHIRSDDPAPASVHADLATFEAWFEAEQGKSFYSLFDQYFPESPVVDF
jgi:hypothetical protein